MNVLALDTALNACSAAIAVDNELVARHHEILARGHAERIVPLIRQICAEAGVMTADLDLIAVTVGPGTFTGVRIGLAAARGLALPQATPVLGVKTLEALAWGVGPGRPVVAAIDARRGELYLQTFDAALEPLIEPTVCTPAAARSQLPQGPAVGIGSGVPLLVPHAPELQPADLAPDPDAGVIAVAAAARAGNATSGKPPSPFYLRPPDAKLPS